MNLELAAVALVVGAVVGLTGMGGGALMTPILVLVFGVPPLTAVSSDMVASAVMKPVGSWVHWRRGTVMWPVARLLIWGSVPAAILGSIAAHFLGGHDGADGPIRLALGAVLVVAAFGLAARAWIGVSQRRRIAGSLLQTTRDAEVTIMRPIATVTIGAVGGFVVGLTSVGAGSLIIVALLVLYPTLRPSQLVGTDLVQAVPLVLAAAISHVWLGGVDWGVAVPVMLGAIPGTYLGARLATRWRGGLVRRALALVLLVSGLELLGLPHELVAVVGSLALVGGSVASVLVRRRFGSTQDGPQPTAVRNRGG